MTSDLIHYCKSILPGHDAITTEYLKVIPTHPGPIDVRIVDEWNTRVTNIETGMWIVLANFPHPEFISGQCIGVQSIRFNEKPLHVLQNLLQRELRPWTVLDLNAFVRMLIAKHSIAQVHFQAICHPGVFGEVNEMNGKYIVQVPVTAEEFVG